MIRPVIPCRLLTFVIHPVSPNIRMLLTIFATFPLSTATAERSFSVLKLVKSNLRSRMGEELTSHWHTFRVTPLTIEALRPMSWKTSSGLIVKLVARARLLRHDQARLLIIVQQDNLIRTSVTVNMANCEAY